MSYLDRVQGEINHSLESILSELTLQKKGPLDRFLTAIRYSMFPGGKRFRPALTLASAEAVGTHRAVALTIGAALEMIHTYSLVHDDLPCMDDAEIRRGKRPTHQEFDEGTAVLVGDGLLTDAFRVLAELPLRHKVAPEIALEIINIVAKSAGTSGMVAGQVLDIQSKLDISFPELQWLAIHKTGKLIHAAILCGALPVSPNDDLRSALNRFGESLGLAFQVIDDLEDANQAIERRIPEAPRASFVQILGVDESRERAIDLIHKSIDALQPLKEAADPLRELARALLDRVPPSLT